MNIPSIKKFCTIIGIILLNNQSYGQSQIDTIVKNAVQQYITLNSMAGISVGVLLQDKKYTYNFGIATSATEKPPTENSIYSMGSISKTFITMLLARAVIDNKVSLQDDIRKYLPDSADFTNLEYNGSAIKILHLSNHTSGIPSQLATLPVQWNQYSVQEKYLFKKKYTIDFFLDDLKKIRLDTTPGIRYEYSNAGFKLLSLLLERIYKMPYEKLVQKFITNDFKMPATQVFLNEKKWKRFAAGTQNPEILKTTKDIDDFTSGPSLTSSVNDMLKYLAINITQKNKAVLLTHKTTFINDDNIEIGMAWRITHTQNGDRYYYHSGSGWGCNSIILFSAEKRVGVIIFVNENTDQARIIATGINLLSQLITLKTQENK
ncbi:serine hydrolase domain-containing protein [Gynurincola endophyticus]|uniref:serine hydrolase domain-containing protein n=1 Tax=Gynurincola endophyticus TaxID=2479004 RepID=UPI000F8ECCE4|nr:serine hydrolase domain-containing protein [Gynurincola endophyticus]